MAKVINFLKTLRNNWKKTTLGVAVLTYGVHYARNKYDTYELMKIYCEDALKYGEMPIERGRKPRRIAVVLNPAANKRKAKNNFEKYCAPLFHLAGIMVDVMQTEYEGQARSLVEGLKETVDAIVVGGGDGTVSEVVTGLLRREDGDRVTSQKFPIGVLPLGQTNTVATSLFAKDSNDVRTMAEATMAVIKEVTKPIDVARIELLEQSEPGKPVYSLAGVEWGAFRDANARRDKYWVWGPLRGYALYVFTGLRGAGSGMTWQCKAKLRYTLPCAGCSNCYQREPKRDLSNIPSSRWWQALIPRLGVSPGTPEVQQVDYSKVINENCAVQHEEDINTVDINLATANTRPDCHQEGHPHIEIKIGPEKIGYIEFVSEGWRRVSGKERYIEKRLYAKELELRPEEDMYADKEKQQWISIDNEDYELKPIHITLLPKKLHVFCTPSSLV